MRCVCVVAVWLLSGCDPAAGGTTDRGARRDPAPRDDHGGGTVTPVPPDAGVMIAGDAAARPLDPPPASDAGAMHARDAGSGSTEPLGECTGTEAECLAARLINDYRARHVNDGECNHPLRWDANLGRLAHEHQSGPFVRHSSHGYIENVGNEFSVEGAVEWILEYTPGVEEHCSRDGTYVASHHCAGMFCNNYTVGVGVYEGGGYIYMTMMFGDRDGQPSW